jgi:hypothetical protein
MGGPEAEAMAIRAARLKAEARAAVREGGSSDRGVQAFVDQIERAVAGSRPAQLDQMNSRKMHQQFGHVCRASNCTRLFVRQ